MPLSQFKDSGFEFAIPKRTTVLRSVIDGKRKKIRYILEWEQKEFGFDAHWHDLNALFVFDKSKDRFVSNTFYTERLYIAHNECLRHGKKLDVNDLYIDYFIKTAKGSEKDAVIVSKDGYQNIPWKRPYLIPIMQTANGPYIRNSITFYICIKHLRPPNTITSQYVHMRKYAIPKTYLDKLNRDYENFTLASFDEWRYGHSSQTIRWNKNDLAHDRYYRVLDWRVNI